MKFNKFTTLLLVPSLAVSSLLFLPAKTGMLPKADSKAFPAKSPGTSVVKVIYNSALATVEPEAQPGTGLASCSVSLSSGFLQGSMALNLFTKPAGCFSITPSKNLVSLKTLTVIDGPGYLPSVVVYDFPQTIQNEFQMPLFPLTQPLPPLPVIFVLLGPAQFFILKFTKPKSYPQKQQRKFQPLLLGQMQVLRC